MLLLSGALRVFTEDQPGCYLFLGLLFEVVEAQAQYGQAPGALCPRGGIMGRRSRQGVVVVVVGQAAVLAASVRPLLVPRGPQLPPSFLAQHLSAFVPCAHPIVVGLVVFHVTNVGFIALSRGASKHVGSLKKS